MVFVFLEYWKFQNLITRQRFHFISQNGISYICIYTYMHHIVKKYTITHNARNSAAQATSSQYNKLDNRPL